LPIAAAPTAVKNHALGAPPPLFPPDEDPPPEEELELELDDDELLELEDEELLLDEEELELLDDELELLDEELELELLLEEDDELLTIVSNRAMAGSV